MVAYGPIYVSVYRVTNDLSPIQHQAINGDIFVNWNFRDDRQ